MSNWGWKQRVAAVVAMGLLAACSGAEVGGGGEVSTKAAPATSASTLTSDLPTGSSASPSFDPTSVPTPSPSIAAYGPPPMDCPSAEAELAHARDTPDREALHHGDDGLTWWNGDDWVDIGVTDIDGAPSMVTAVLSDGAGGLVVQERPMDDVRRDRLWRITAGADTAVLLRDSSRDVVDLFDAGVMDDEWMVTGIRRTADATGAGVALVELLALDDLRRIPTPVAGLAYEQGSTGVTIVDSLAVNVAEYADIVGVTSVDSTGTVPTPDPWNQQFLSIPDFVSHFHPVEGGYIAVRPIEDPVARGASRFCATVQNTATSFTRTVPDPSVDITGLDGEMWLKILEFGPRDDLTVTTVVVDRDHLSTVDVLHDAWGPLPSTDLKPPFDFPSGTTPLIAEDPQRWASIILSLSKDEGSAQDAEGQAAALVGRAPAPDGPVLPTVIDSDTYPGLQPGLWVAVALISFDEEDAVNQCARLVDDGVDCDVRELITPL